MKISFNGLGRQAQSEIAQLKEICCKSILEADYISGQSVASLEFSLASKFGFGNVIGVSSGSSALNILMNFLKKEGHHGVLVASNCGGYATNAALNAGLNVFVVDVSKRTALLDLTELERISRLTNGSVLVYTHLYGNYADFDEIVHFCRSNGIVLIEDCAQALGLKYGDSYVGTKSDYSILSFYPTKNLGSLGDAGAIVVNGDLDDSPIREMRNYGWEDKYVYKCMVSTNNRMDSIQADVLLFRLSALSDWNQRRREIRSQYVEHLNRNWGEFFECQETVGHLAALRSTNRTQFASYLAQQGIQTSVHYPLSDTQQPAWKAQLSSDSDPVARELCSQTISLPCYPQLSDLEIEYVCKVISRTA